VRSGGNQWCDTSDVSNGGSDVSNDHVFMALTFVKKKKKKAMSQHPSQIKNHHVMKIVSFIQCVVNNLKHC